jgi:hypothetical protein
MSDKYYYQKGAVHNDHKHVMNINLSDQSDIKDLMKSFFAEEAEDAEVVQDADEVMSVPSETMGMKSSNPRRGGRRPEFLFKNRIGKKDEERTKMMASVFSNYLKEQGLSDTIIDTSRGNEINKIFVRFYRKMVKSENIESQPNGSACFRFLTEDCGLKIAPNMKTYGTFISRMINDA